MRFDDFEYKSHRRLFFESWLEEMPRGTGPTNMFSQIQKNINELIEYELDVIDITDNFHKIENGDTLYYWFGKENNVDVGVELTKKSQTLQVNIIGKRNKNSAPYASDLYTSILNDNKSESNINNIRLSSDKFLSDNGLNIWKRLIKDGHKISLYDNTKPGQSLTLITSEEELLKYFKHDDKSYEKYQYILSESGKNYGGLRVRFGTRSYWESTGLPQDMINS